MAHAKKPDFVFRRNGQVHLNRQGRQFSRLLAAEVCASAVVMLDTSCSRGGAKGTGYPLHSAVSPSLPRPCVTVCHHISAGVYHKLTASGTFFCFNPLNAKLNPICLLLAILGARHIFQVSALKFHINLPSILRFTN